MPALPPARLRCGLLAAAALAAALPLAVAQDAPAGPVTTGQRVFTCGHSFHVWVPDILADLAGKAGIAGHTQVGVSSIGGSRVVQHWAVPDDKNRARAALRT